METVFFNSAKILLFLLRAFLLFVPPALVGMDMPGTIHVLKLQLLIWIRFLDLFKVLEHPDRTRMLRGFWLRGVVLTIYGD